MSTRDGVVAERGERIALSVEPIAGVRARLRIERDAPEGRHDLDVIDRRLPDVDVVRRVETRAHVVDAPLADGDGFGERLGIERLDECGNAGGAAQQRGESECGRRGARARHGRHRSADAGGRARSSAIATARKRLRPPVTRGPWALQLSGDFQWRIDC